MHASFCASYSLAHCDADNAKLAQVGTLHTHPAAEAMPSARDLHNFALMQRTSDVTLVHFVYSYKEDAKHVTKRLLSTTLDDGLVSICLQAVFENFCSHSTAA